MIPVDATEEMILNYDALPKQLNGWRRYRIEYRGCNEDCFLEYKHFEKHLKRMKKEATNEC